VSDPEPHFNPLFAQFTEVSDSEWLQGLVAYGLYKRAKREWTADLFKRDGRSPTETELAAYERTWTRSQIDGKRAEAEIALSEYADNVVRAATPAIEKRVLKGGIWRAVGYGIAANLAYTLLLIGFVVVLRLFGVDIIGLAEKIGPPQQQFAAPVPGPSPASR
jgi:hypothetical protein